MRFDVGLASPVEMPISFPFYVRWISPINYLFLHQNLVAKKKKAAVHAPFRMLYWPAGTANCADVKYSNKYFMFFKAVNSIFVSQSLRHNKK